MLLPSSLWLFCVAALGARAQDATIISASDSATSTSDSSDSSSSSSSRSSRTSSASNSPVLFTFTNAGTTLTGTEIPTALPTGSDITYLTGTTQSIADTSTRSSNATMTTSSNSQITVSSKSVSLTQIVGGNNATMTSNSTMTASSTSSAAAPTNTIPCNGFPEFCNRQYSNISMVVAHNAAFVQANNAASNQLLGVMDQLNDGVRMISGEVHWNEANQTLYNCHSSCDLLNTGPYENTLSTVRQFLEDNPYDVVSVLIVNSDYVSVDKFVPAITNAGLLPYVYEPSYIPQYRSQWPTLSEMILSNQRVVIFMDYQANQTAVPYILDEFSHIWETPFSPVDQAFPCTQQRPPDLNQTRARDDYMYLANHNLNTAIDLSALGIDTDGLLVPNTAELNVTNAKGTEFGMLGLMSQNCTEMWGRPPNFLLVDYYNVGPSGDNSPDVFDVAASDNGVVYTLDCCGNGGQENGAAALTRRMSVAALAVAIAFGVLSVW